MALAGSDLFFYEGRTIRGLGIAAWALLIQLAAVVTSGAALVGLALLLGPVTLNPSGSVAPVLGLVAAVCGIEVAQIAMAVVFLVGFHHLHAGRHEYGLEHTKSLDRASLFLALFAALTAVNIVYNVAMDFFAPLGQSPLTGSLLEGNVLVAPASACFAGLTLLYSARALGEPPAVRRLRSGLILGILGAFVGPALLAFETMGNPLSVSAMATGFLAGAVAGYGTSALSLLLFYFAFQDIHRELVAGRPAPVLPRYEEAYPWPQIPPGPLVPSSPPGRLPPKP